MRRFVLFLLAPALMHAEVYTLSLRDAIARALHDGPDMVLARLDLVKAQLAVKVARDPFVAQGLRRQRCRVDFGLPGEHQWRPTRQSSK